MLGRKYRQIRGLADSNFALHPQYPRRPHGEQLHHPLQADPLRVHKLQRQPQRGFKSRHAKRRAIEFHFLRRRLVRSVVRSNRVHCAVRQSLQQRLAILARAQRRIHLAMRVVAHLFIDHREMMRRHFARNRQALVFRHAHYLQRSARRKMRHMKSAPGQFRHLNVAPHANRFRRRRHPANPGANRSRPFAH